MQSRAYIEERSIPIPFSGCWLWLLSRGSHGYGNACIGDGVTTAHRVSYAAFVAPIPSGMLVEHSCDNRWCVNPDHLSVGTDATNAEDKRRKGRAAKKLTRAQVEEIRMRYVRGSSKSLGREFGVSASTITNIISGRTWRPL